MKNTSFYLRLLFLFAFLLVFMPELKGQDVMITPVEKLSEGNEDNEIVVKYNNENHPTRIEFVSKVSGEICNSFDLRENNPFLEHNLPLYQKKENHSIFPKFDLAGVSKSKIIQTFLPTIEEEPYNSCDAAYASTYGAVFPDDKDIGKARYIVVRYGVYIFNDLEELLALNQYWIRMDNKGQILMRAKNMYQNMYHTKITEDGRYWAYLSGGLGNIHSECDLRGINAQTGFQIFDTHTGRVVVNKKGSNITHPTMKEGLIRVVYNLPERKKEYHIFDMTKYKEYVRAFEISELSNLKEINETGFLFANISSNNSFIEYNYEKDFIVKPIKKQD